MKAISRQLILYAFSLLLCFAIADVSYAASAVRPLSISKIKGKPGIPFGSNKNEIIRLMELLIIGNTLDSAPIEQLLYFDGYKDTGEPLCRLAARHLIAKERTRVLSKAHAKKTPRECTVNGEQLGWAGRHKLEREDNKNIFKQKLLPQIKKAAAKVASMKGFQEITVVGRVHIRPDDYSREKGGFTFRNSFRMNSPPMMSLKDFKHITVWKMAEARARQLMGGLLATSQGQLLQVETVIELGGVDKTIYKGGLTRYGISGRIKSITLYANSDKSLSNPLHRFAREDFTDMAAIAAREKGSREQARIAGLKKVELVDSKYFSAAYAELSGKGLKLVDEIIAHKRYSGSPFEKNKQKDKDRAQMKKTLKQALSSFDSNKKVWVSGVISLQPYNINESHFPLSKITIHIGENNRDEKNQWVRAQLITSQIGKLPIPADIAKSMIPQETWRQGAHVGAFRALVKPVSISEVQGSTVELAIERLVLLEKNQHIAILDDTNVIWSYTPPNYKKLMADASQKKASEQEEIEQQKKVCAASKEPVSCYPKLCERIRKTGDTKGWKSCMKESKQAIREWKNSQWSGINNKRNAKDEKNRQSMVIERMCRRKYTGYVVQPWMPVKGTPEFKKAMIACQNESVRNIYGPDILGLRLGMKLDEVNNFIRRQSVNKNTTLKDTRPFEKATLYWTDDANHGIAVFSVVNGEHERVAAVSRRLYFADKVPTVKQTIKGLQKKYGAALWSRGERTMLWASPKGGERPSARKCSGLVDLIAPRAGWNREWGSSNRRSEDREQRRAARMAAVAPQQQCIAKHGMPGSPEAMQALARCMQEFTANVAAPSQSSGKSGSSARLPFMIRASGEPTLYKGYETCGAVTIAHLNTDDSGTLKDMSIMLFDPSWIAHQPAFAFDNEKGGGQLNF